MRRISEKEKISSVSLLTPRRIALSDLTAGHKASGSIRTTFKMFQ